MAAMVDGGGETGTDAGGRPEERPDAPPDAPLGRPPGTVRAYLALAIVGTFLAGHLGGAVLLLRSGSPESGLALLGALAIEAATVIGFYFGARQHGASS